MDLMGLVRDDNQQHDGDADRDQNRDAVGQENLGANLQPINEGDGPGAGGEPDGGNVEGAEGAERMQPINEGNGPGAGEELGGGNAQGDVDAPGQEEEDHEVEEAPGNVGGDQRAADIERLRNAAAEAKKEAAKAKKEAKKTKAEAKAKEKAAKKSQEKAEAKMEELRKPARAAAAAAAEATTRAAAAREAATAAREVVATREAAVREAVARENERINAAREEVNVARREVDAADRSLIFAEANVREAANAGAEAKQAAAEEKAAAEERAATAAEAVTAAERRLEEVEIEEARAVEEARASAAAAVAEAEAAEAQAEAAEDAARVSANAAHETQLPVAIEADAAAKEEKKKNEASTAIAAAKEKAQKAKEKAEKIKAEANKAEAGDDYNLDVLNAAAEAGGMEVAQERPDPNRAFDTLDDLKNLAQDANRVEQDNMAEDPKNNELKELRQAVMQARKGNLYKAVIMSKDPDAAAQAQGDAPGRFSRFMNNSIVSKGLDIGGKFIDKGGKVAKTVNAASGIAASFSDDYKESSAFGIIDLINNGMILLSSIKNIIKDIKEIKDFNKNKTSTEKKVFTVISLVSNFSMAIAKVAAIVKFITDKKNMKKTSGVLDTIKNAATLVSQTGTLAGGINSLRKLHARRSGLKADQKKTEENLGDILNNIENNNGNQVVDGNGNQEEDDNGNQVVDGNGNQEEDDNGNQAGNNNRNQVVDGNGNQAGNNNGNQAVQRENRQEGVGANGDVRARVARVRSVAWDQNPNLSEDQKATLGSYFAREKALAKNKTALVDAYFGLVTNVLGMGSTIAGVVDKRVGNDASATAKKYVGLAANGGVIINTALKPAVGKVINRKTEEEKEQENAEKEQIKNSLWGAVQGLQGDAYGLRRIANNLAYDDDNPPQPDEITNAKNAVTRYNAVAKQIDPSVDYGEFFAGKDEEDFKNALVAGI